MKEEIRQLIFFGAIISLGVLANIANQFLNGRRKGKKTDWSAFIAGAIISIFSGVVFALLSSFVTDSIAVQWACAGMGSYLGVNGVNALAANALNSISNVKIQK